MAMIDAGISHFGHLESRIRWNHGANLSDGFETAITDV